MSMTRKFKLTDVRSFIGTQEFDIKPLTFVVGENSTGKTTLLGCLQVLAHDYKAREINFNIPPYQMGTFDNIASKMDAKQARKFQLGFELDYDKQSIECMAAFVKQKNGNNPVIKKVEYKFNRGKKTEATIVLLKKHLSKRDRERMLHLEFGTYISIADTTRDKCVFYIDERVPLLFRFGILTIERFHRKRPMSILRAHLEDIIKSDHATFGILLLWADLITAVPLELLRSPFGSVSSIGPARSQPKRNYDPFQVPETGDGSDIPIYLASLHRSNPKTWNSLKNKLVKFGEASGLFNDIIVREFGETKDDPLQLHFEVRSFKANIMDIGYGVSQILPLLVKILQSVGSTFLIQQPEVHLHPTAQAEFTSLLVATLNKNQRYRNTFVIETHTDYMIDRARIEIRNGKIAPEDVSLIYLEPLKASNQVKVHNITFDKQSNFIGAPPSYGKFFMEESHRLLGFTEMPKR